MKKSVLKLLVFFLTFLLSLVVVSKIINKGHDNLTMEMASSSLPLVTMVMSGVEYNQLHGYLGAANLAFQRDTTTVLGEGRDTGFVIDTYGQEIVNVSIEVRSVDGSRLIENTEITGLRTDDGRIRGNIALKDLIERDTEYSLTISLGLGDGRKASYYTRAIWDDSLHAQEKLDFVMDFHERLYDREAARELTKYLETNSRLEDNSSFHNVNIHSSFRQITWGDLNVTEETAPTVNLFEIAEQTASLSVDYVVSTTDGKNAVYYMVEEFYRIRYTTDRMYLLQFERTMTQIPNTEQMTANDKILLGITAADIPMMESEDGNTVVFEVANQLLSYNVTTNKLTSIFCFYDSENADARTLYGQHTIRILDVDEGGDVQFAVYGYMNRGRHEGEVGIQIYTYKNARNTIEELIYIPYDKTYSVLAAQMDQLLYLNRESKLYLILDNVIYGVDLVEKTYSRLLDIVQDDSLQVSGNHKIAVWPEGKDIFHSNALYIRNFGINSQHIVSVTAKEAIRPLGFMEEDIIYGVAYTADVREDSTGRTFFPMYKICICSSSGELLKEYRQPDIYVTDCTIADNQITLERVERLETGAYEEIAQDHIMNNTETEVGKNVIVTADIDRYERYVEIQVRKNIDSKSIKILTPKEVVYEGGRKLQFTDGQDTPRYYVYGPYGVSGIFCSPANAVQLADSVSGVVENESGSCIWLRGNRAARNQIMSIKETLATEEKSPLAVCLDTLLANEGISRNTQNFLDRGEKIPKILEDNLESMVILDLTGCSLDAVLYYVDRDIPVLSLLEDGSAVLLVGFNESEVGIMDPKSGTIYRQKMALAKEWFDENGNQFFTYMRKQQ